jgi:hypothetical protein
MMMNGGQGMKQSLGRAEDGDVGMKQPFENAVGG